MDKYGVGQDSYCYPGTSTLINHLAYLQSLHRHLFQDLYGWAGEIRTVDIAKDDTRFAVACDYGRLETIFDRCIGQPIQ